MQKYFIKINTKKTINITVFFLLFISTFLSSFVNTTYGAFNKQINYQGKLTTSANIAVANGNYAMEFKLYTVDTGGTAIWTETRTGANEVTVTSGLFSVMLGSVSSLASVDFNQTPIYLGVKIGADNEMTPRKILGSVPSSFVSDKTLNFVGGNSSTLLGSIPYQSNTDTTTLVSPNTTTTKKFFRMTGTGTNGAIPAWDTLVDGDLPSALTGKTYNALTLTSLSTGFSIAGGTTSKTLTVNNTLGLTGTDGSTLNIGTGGTLGTNAYNSTAYLPLTGGTLTGNLLFTDNTYDIGASGATRPRTGYFGTSLFSPLVVGGTSTTSDLFLKTTSGVGATGADMHFLVGSNGATEAMTILNSGNVGINTLAPTYHLDVKGTAASDGIRSDMGFDIYQVPDPTAPTGVVSTGGSVDTGTHYYRVSYITATGETHGTLSAVITTTAGNNTVTLTIPTSTDPRVTGRKLYRTKAGAASYSDYYLATIAENTSTSYVDTLIDSSLTGNSGASQYRLNTTSNNITVNGVKSFTIDQKGTIIGYQAGDSFTTGGRSTIVGASAGNRITTGTDEYLFGEAAGYNITTGSQNSLYGYSSGFSVTIGGSNTAMGYSSMFYPNAGSQLNTAIGSLALMGVSGNALSYNTAIGASAGRSLTTGTSNTFLGYEAGYHASQLVTATNSMAIGYGAYTTASNQVVIGNTSVTQTLLNGNVGIGTTNPGGRLDVSPTVTATTDLKGMLSGLVYNGASPMTNYFGHYLAAPTGTGTITNKYALVTEANAGNVGIGTIAPTEKIEVVGNIYINNSGGYLKFFNGFKFTDGTGTVTVSDSTSSPIMIFDEL